MSQVLEKAISKNPNNAQALNFLGYYLVDRTKQIERGGEYIKKSLELAPKDSATIDSLAWYYYKKGDYRTEIDVLDTSEDILLDLRIDLFQLCDEVLDLKALRLGLSVLAAR